MNKHREPGTPSILTRKKKRKMERYSKAATRFQFNMKSIFYGFIIISLSICKVSTLESFIQTI